MPFEKGHSGNPGGRPKESAEVKELARKHSTEAFNRVLALMRSDQPKVALSAAQEVLNRAWGKAPASLEVSGEIRQPTVIRAPEVETSTEAWMAKYAPPVAN